LAQELDFSSNACGIPPHPEYLANILWSSDDANFESCSIVFNSL